MALDVRRTGLGTLHNRDAPRYRMGVGCPLYLVVCTALWGGGDMYDCVYPIGTARCGVALVPGDTPGTLS